MSCYDQADVWSPFVDQCQKNSSIKSKIIFPLFVIIPLNRLEVSRLFLTMFSPNSAAGLSRSVSKSCHATILEN